MATRFFRRNKTKVYFILDGTQSFTYNQVTATESPSVTAADLNRAAPSVVALHPQIASISGFQLSNSPIKTPDLNTTFDAEIPGVDQTSQSSMEFYAPDDTSAPSATPILTTLVKDTKGFVVFFPTGIAAGQRFEVWPVIVTSTSNAYSLGNDAAKFMVDFSVYARPDTNANAGAGAPSGINNDTSRNTF